MRVRTGVTAGEDPVRGGLEHDQGAFGLLGTQRGHQPGQLLRRLPHPAQYALLQTVTTVAPTSWTSRPTWPPSSRIEAPPLGHHTRPARTTPSRTQRWVGPARNALDAANTDRWIPVRSPGWVALKLPRSAAVRGLVAGTAAGPARHGLSRVLTNRWFSQWDGPFHHAVPD